MADSYRIPSEHKSSVTPVQSGERIEFVDILRGFAVYGILVMNITAFSGQSLNAQSMSDPIDRLVVNLVNFLFQAKFYSLFSLLFGWGVSVQMDRALAKGVRFVPIYLRRTFILLIIGIIHSIFIWDGDILTLYALLGILLLLFRKSSGKVLLMAVALCLMLSIVLTLPWGVMDNFRNWYSSVTSFLYSERLSEVVYTTGTYLETVQYNLQETLNGHSKIIYSMGNVFSMFLLGLYIGKRKIFQNVKQNLPNIRVVMWVGLVIGVIFNGIFVYNSNNPGWVPVEYTRFVRVGSRTIGAPALMLFYVTGIILLLQKDTWWNNLLPLKNVGRMALTNYLLQSVICTLIFFNYGLGLYAETSATFNQILVILIFLGQIRISAWWFERYQFGPMEWLWRTLTYGRRPPMRSKETYSDLKPSPWVMKSRQLAKKANPLFALTSVWFLLLVWGSSLLLWNVRLNSLGSQEPFQIILKVTATQDNTPLDDLDDGAPSIGDRDTLSPEVQSVDYQPGPIAASGDVWALASTFDTESAFAQIETLSAPVFMGRHAGSPGGKAAGDYIAEQFASFGLQPAGDKGTFFQPFPVSFTPLKGAPSLVVLKPDGTESRQYDLHEDFSPIVRWYSGPGMGSGEVVWVNDCSLEDFKGLDVVGKVVLCKNMPGSTPVRESSRYALEYGAVGLLLLTDPDVRPPDFGYTFRETWVPEPLPTLRVYPSLVDDLLSGSGKTVVELTSTNEPFDLATKVIMEVSTSGEQACPDSGCQGRNVLGVIPGRDPEYADEVVILGAHYDHLGKAPDGLVWPGANDDASGVAVLLEIARSWQEQGYLPQRTVVFAAWDAEEVGLVGSRFYVENPRYSLDNTIAMFQLDMVGAGPDVLSISGEEILSDQLYAVSVASGVESEVTEVGRSDHAPFLEANIPASMLMWYVKDQVIPHYHRPIDVPEVIDLDKLEAVARITQIAVLDLVESEPAIESLLAQRADAVVNGDLESFLMTSHPGQETIDRYWFADVQSFSPTRVELRSDSIQVNGPSASANIEMIVEYPGNSTHSPENVKKGRLVARLERGEDGWLWAGPNLVWSQVNGSLGSELSLVQERCLPVAYPPEVERNPSPLGCLAGEKYTEISSLLDLPIETDASLLLYPDPGSLQVSTAMSLPPDTHVWVTPDEMKLVYSERISTSIALEDALTHLVLAESGVTESAAPWFWEGLPLVLRAQEDMVGAHIEYIPQLIEYFQAESQYHSEVASWAATDYLLWRLGWDGLGAFITDLGQACGGGQCETTEGLDIALTNNLQLDSADFNPVWQRLWRARLETVQENLDTILAERVNAVMNDDESTFLNSVDPNIPNLIEQERYWFADLEDQPLDSFSLSASPMALLENGSVLALVTMSYQFDDQDGNGNEKNVSMEISFTPDDAGYRWAGAPFKEQSDLLVNVRYPAGHEELATALLEDGQVYYSQIAAVFGIEDPDELTLELYKDKDSFRTSISLSYSPVEWASTWTGPGGGIKLHVGAGASPEDYHPALVTGITRNLLHQIGVDSEWLLKGVSTYISAPFDGRAAQMAAASGLPGLSLAAHNGELLDLQHMHRDDELSRGEFILARTQAWDAVRFLIHSYGWDTLLELLHTQGQKPDFESAFLSSTGESLDSFQQAWKNSLSVGHVLPQWMEIVESFDQDIAKGHVDTLAKPELEGRRAGTRGANEAARYIGGKFEVYGLEPEGDLEGGTFFQHFPISDTAFISGPNLYLLDTQERPNFSFTFRDDFILIRPVTESVGSVSGELVWVKREQIQDADLDGKIVVLKPSTNVENDISWAQRAGAEGLILAGFKQKEEEITPKQPLMNMLPLVSDMPVAELTYDGTSRFLSAIGQDRESIRKLPDVHPLGISARLDLAIADPETVGTTNVLGFLPGSDPILSQEVVILGAHYDHVGDDPDIQACVVDGEGTQEDNCKAISGLKYSGANDNASGVGVLLEIARLWQESGYRPQRSVLFAAWGAQEIGQLGSRYYLEHPTIPLKNVVGMIQLDGVGGGGGFNPGIQASPEQDGLLLYSMAVAEQLLDEKITITSKLEQSDHITFDDNGIPSMLVSWRLAGEMNLPDDIANGVSSTRLGIIGRLVTLALMSLVR